MSHAQTSRLPLINRISLATQIIIGLIAGILLALFFPAAAASAGLAGTVLVPALKAVAPVLVFVLVAASIANHKQGRQTHLRPILLQYLVSAQYAKGDVGQPAVEAG